MKKTIFAAFFAAAAAISAPAGAATYDVDALLNSSSGGAGLPTIALIAGHSFAVSVNPSDLWSAGSLPRWSNADGLTGPLFATGSDESGEATGTQIGADFGFWTQANLTAPYGTLVGQIGGGDYFVIGTSFTGVASASGVLNLYYWDSNNLDNKEFVTATVSAIPEPATWAMMLMGFVGLAVATRRRRPAAMIA